jgi:hypothetical protein
MRERQARSEDDAGRQPAVPEEAGVQALDHRLPPRLPGLRKPRRADGADGARQAMGGRHNPRVKPEDRLLSGSRRASSTWR